MSGPFAVDLGRLDSVVTAQASFEKALEQRLDNLDQRIQKIHGVWAGDAANAQQAAHNEWMAGAREMHSALIALRKAAATAHANYSSAVAANQQMW